MASGDTTLRLYNTLTRTKEKFAPIDPANVRMYVCGPTVYDFAHIGNARPAIVFDLLFRLLRQVYGEDHVTYVRNITDVDDKINARAARDFPALPLNEAIRRVTETTAAQYLADVTALGCLEPTMQPRATENIAGMQTLIGTLLRNGHAYEAAGEVLFDVSSMPDYGALSGRNLDEQLAGARVAVDAHKKHPADFVLWKQSSADEPGWDSPWGRGRPGWHIECSAMSERYLGQVFDIHAGGLDLIFPHHENEIAQSRCAHGTPTMANIWMHNGFLQVEGKKMSKSEGNFVTINELLATEKFGGRKWPGEVLRLAMLKTHYRDPIDFTVRSLHEAETLFLRLQEVADERTKRTVDVDLEAEFIGHLLNDLDSSAVLNRMAELTNHTSLRSEEIYTIYKYAKVLGFKFKKSRVARVASLAGRLLSELGSLDEAQVDAVRRAPRRPSYRSGRVRPEYELYVSLKAVSSFARALPTQGMDRLLRRIRNSIAHGGSQPESKRLISFSEFLDQKRSLGTKIDAAVAARLTALNAKDFAEADRIRTALLADGIQLMDSKDPATGERVTKWEVKR